LQTLFIIFLSAAAIQVIYFIVLIISISKKRFDQTVALKPISVIVCAHDEEQNLRELIPALLKQQHPEFEIIIVNDRSNDGTYDWLIGRNQKRTKVENG
jgi:cellulose synthase/poly-beta-1,6-N-acetylglucosamine synthase-like glycosyltransferase